jgi:hypothetical protein
MQVLHHLNVLEIEFFRVLCESKASVTSEELVSNVSTEEHDVFTKFSDLLSNEPISS